MSNNKHVCLEKSDDDDGGDRNNSLISYYIMFKTWFFGLFEFNYLIHHDLKLLYLPEQEDCAQLLVQKES